MAPETSDREGIHEQTSGCLPVDQSCFALSRLSNSYRGGGGGSGAACCSTTSYLEVLGISFASLLVILFVLCMIRCYLMRRAVNRVTVGSASGPGAGAAGAAKKLPTGLSEAAIAALPKFAYRGTGDERECAICLSAMADGEVARQLPMCMHLFHGGCIDEWLVAHTTCPVCRAEVVKHQPDGDDVRRSVERPPAAEAGPSSEPAAGLENGERDLEAQS